MLERYIERKKKALKNYPIKPCICYRQKKCNEEYISTQNWKVFNFCISCRSFSLNLVSCRPKKLANSFSCVECSFLLVFYEVTVMTTLPYDPPTFPSIKNAVPEICNRFKWQLIKLITFSEVYLMSEGTLLLLLQNAWGLIKKE